jgi:hypothetical protein
VPFDERKDRLGQPRAEHELDAVLLNQPLDNLDAARGVDSSS